MQRTFPTEGPRSSLEATIKIESWLANKVKILHSWTD